jgi:hypothetical protein
VFNGHFVLGRDLGHMLQAMSLFISALGILQELHSAPVLPQERLHLQVESPQCLELPGCHWSLSNLE